jgi:hypothetical protein
MGCGLWRWLRKSKHFSLSLNQLGKYEALSTDSTTPAATYKLKSTAHPWLEDFDSGLHF